MALVDQLEALSVPYFVGGSVASSAYGIPRTTLDIDLVVDLDSRVVSELVGRLKNAFYVDEEMIVDAVERRASFNVIHLQTMIKLDVFVLKAAVFRGRSSW